MAIRLEISAAVQTFFQGDYSTAREQLMAAGLSARQARRLWNGVGLPRAELMVGVLAAIPSLTAPLAPFAAKASGSDLSIVQALSLVKPGHAFEYWVTDLGVDLAESGLEAWAAGLLGIDPDSTQADLVTILIRMHGYISLCATGDGPLLISWSVLSVDPVALAHLKRQLEAWPTNSHGYRVSTEVASSLFLPSKAEAILFVERALSQCGFASGKKPNIESQRLPLADATAKLCKVGTHFASFHSSSDVKLDIDPSLIDTAVVYHVTDSGLFTAAVGASLPLLFGITAGHIIGRPTLSEPTPRPYLDMVVAQVSEAVASRQTTLYHIHLSQYPLDVEYQRLTVPLTHQHKVVGAVTIADKFRGIS